MKTFFKVSIILMMAIVLAAGTALAAPARLDSITVADGNNNLPSNVAADAQGNLYVSVPASNAVRKYSAAGQPLGSISVPRPAGLAVDASGNIYVCSVNYKSRANKNSVLIFNADLVNTGSLGIGAGEFSKPIDVAIDGNGRIYVVDAGSHKIKVFDAAGNFAFGAFGNAAGMFNKPIGIAINDAAGELYVTDRPAYTDANGTTVGARIQVFDKNGAFKRSFGKFGAGVGQIQSPQGIAVDGAGTLYVADSGQNVVHVLNPADGSAVGAGGVYDPVKPGYNPGGVATTRNGLLCIVYQRGETPAGRIDRYGLDGFVTMAVDPSSLTFAGTQFFGNPAPQTIVITNTGSGTLNWSAAADQAWIKLGKMDPVAPASAAGLAVGVDIASLGVASYTGKVTIDSGFGQTAVIGIALNIAPAPVLNISNGWLSFTARRGKSPAAQAIAISIDNASPAQQWSVTSDSAWLSITPASAASATASVAVDSANLKAGSYTGLLTVSAPGVIGDGGKITVNLTVAPSSRIQVTTNREDANFTVSGAASFKGSGLNWSMDDVPAGDYTVTYDAVPGYKKPRTQTTALIENGSIAFSGDYVSLQALAAKKKIVVARSSGDALVRAYGNSGAPVAFDLKAFDTKHGVNIAVGDIDGDGAAELIAGAGDGEDNPALVRIFRADKSLLLEFVPFGSLNGVRVAAGDLDGDGKAEVIVTPSAGSENAGTVAVYAYDAATGKMASTGISFAAHPAPYGANVATADLDGSGRAAIVTAAGVGKKNHAVVKVWKIDTAKPGNWSASQTNEIALSGRKGASIAAADVDGDGKDEIVAGFAGFALGESSVVTTIKADGTQTRFNAFRKAGVNVAAADLDGDGKAEIIAARGRDTVGEESSENQSQNQKQKTTKKRDSDDAQDTVRVYTAAGEQKFSLAPFDDSNGSINVAVGDLGL